MSGAGPPLRAARPKGRNRVFGRIFGEGKEGAQPGGSRLVHVPALSRDTHCQYRPHASEATENLGSQAQSHVCSAPLACGGEAIHAICFTVPLFLSGINCVDFSAFSYLLFHLPSRAQEKKKQKHPTSFYFSLPDPGGEDE